MYVTKKKNIIKKNFRHLKNLNFIVVVLKIFVHDDKKQNKTASLSRLCCMKNQKKKKKKLSRIYRI